jgi:hypothetical protein
MPPFLLPLTHLLFPLASSLFFFPSDIFISPNTFYYRLPFHSFFSLSPYLFSFFSFPFSHFIFTKLSLFSFIYSIPPSPSTSIISFSLANYVFFLSIINFSSTIIYFSKYCFSSSSLSLTILSFPFPFFLFPQLCDVFFLFISGFQSFF